MSESTIDRNSPERPRRLAQLESLAREVGACASSLSLSRRLFLILWELPIEVQIEIAVATAEMYLPRFERKHPTLTRLRELFERARSGAPRPSVFEVDEWRLTLQRHGADEADLALHGAACDLAEARNEGAAPITVTSGCVAATQDAIASGWREAWAASDPVAVEAWRARHRDPLDAAADARDLRDPWNNGAVLATFQAGWETVVATLRAAELGQYPNVHDRDTLAEAIRRLRPGVGVMYPRATQARTSLDERS